MAFWHSKVAFWQKENFQFLQAQYIQQLNTDSITLYFNSFQQSRFQKTAILLTNRNNVARATFKFGNSSAIFKNYFW